MSNYLSSVAPPISSREISELVDSRHDDVKRSIDRLVSQGVMVQPPVADEPGTDAMGRPRATLVYVFAGDQGKRDSVVVVAQLSPEFTARLVDRWQELETLASGRGVMSAMQGQAAGGGTEGASFTGTDAQDCCLAAASLSSRSRSSLSRSRM